MKGRGLISDFAMALLALSLFSLMLFCTGDDIGITVDEPIYTGIALHLRDWFSLLLFDPSLALSKGMLDAAWWTKDMHPPLVKVLSALSMALFEGVAPPLSSARGGSMALFALLFFGLYISGRMTLGPLCGWLCALSLLSLPRLFGHAHLAATDLPATATSFLVALSVFWWSRSPRLRRVPLVAVAFSLALLSKASTALPGAASLLWAVANPRGRRRSWQVLFGAVCGLGLFLLLWPAMWHDTMKRLGEFLSFHWRHFPVAVWYFGRSYVVAPWHYPFVMLLFTTPLPVLVCSGFGLYALKRYPKEAREFLSLCLLCLGATILPFALPNTPKYNGVRLFLPALPFLAAISGHGAATLSKALSSALPGGERRLGPMAVTLGLLLGVSSTVRVHPFELSYYGALCGGLKGAERLGLEPTYWADTFLYIVPELNRICPEGALVLVTPPGNESLLRFYKRAGALRPDIRLSGDEKHDLGRADFLTFQCTPSQYGRLQRWLVRNEAPVAAVEHDGVRLCVVYSWDSIERALISMGW